MLTCGATADEVAGRYPGDDLIPDPDGGATMATTLTAPPETVWSWLVQMGGDRGGWYDVAHRVQTNAAAIHLRGAQQLLAQLPPAETPAIGASPTNEGDCGCEATG